MNTKHIFFLLILSFLIFSGCGLSEKACEETVLKKYPYAESVSKFEFIHVTECGDILLLKTYNLFKTEITSEVLIPISQYNRVKRNVIKNSRFKCKE